MITTERPTQLLIGGTWRAGQEDRTFDVAEPATSEVMAKAAVASPADVDTAVTAARGALPPRAPGQPAPRARAQSPVKKRGPVPAQGGPPAPPGGGHPR